MLRYMIALFAMLAGGSMVESLGVTVSPGAVGCAAGIGTLFLLYRRREPSTDAAQAASATPLSDLRAHRLRV